MGVRVDEQTFLGALKDWANLLLLGLGLAVGYFLRVLRVGVDHQQVLMQQSALLHRVTALEARMAAGDVSDAEMRKDLQYIRERIDHLVTLERKT